MSSKIIEYAPQGKRPTVAILTNFMDFNPGYSLSGIVIDQAHMLAKNGHRVLIFVSEQYNDNYEVDSGLADLQVRFSQIEVLKKTKFIHLTDYTKKAAMSDDHRIAAKEAGEIFADIFKQEKVEFVFTHDFVFTGWNLPFAEAIKYTHNSLVNAKKTKVKWFHWIHSVPSANRDWWQLEAYGQNHSLVFPNKTEIMRVAESYRTTANRVNVIPHIKDIRNWYDFGKESTELIDNFPAIMNAEIIQVYPCSTDRMSAKQLDLVFKIFAHMKLSGRKNVFLIIANQWATGRQRQEDVDAYIENAESIGLINTKDFLFTSKWPGFEKGIGKRMLRELQLLSDVFIFPTREESFGLVGPEASFSGCLPVINKSLTMMYEVMGNQCPAFEFGSFHTQAPAITNDDYLKAVAMAILGRIYADESVTTKSFCRRRYNMETLYSQYYLPLLTNI